MTEEATKTETPKKPRKKLAGSPITVRVELSEEAARAYLKKYDPRESVSIKQVRGALVPILEGHAAEGVGKAVKDLEDQYRKGFAAWAQSLAGGGEE